jgi:hypothetical protein
MANYYRVRLTHLYGAPIATAKVFKLAPSVKLMDQLCELAPDSLPYQVIHRNVKGAGVWAHAFFQGVPMPERGTFHPGRMVVISIEDLGPDGDESDELPQLLLPPGFVEQPLPMIHWSDADFEDYKQGRPPVHYVKG